MDRGQVSGEVFAGDWTDVGTPERIDKLNLYNQHPVKVN
jgi:MurNAc alpha-1-phosphate uridylyltransferase